jgi:hypothetical protein
VTERVIMVTAMGIMPPPFESSGRWIGGHGMVVFENPVGFEAAVEFEKLVAFEKPAVECVKFIMPSIKCDTLQQSTAAPYFLNFLNQAARIAFRRPPSFPFLSLVSSNRELIDGVADGTKPLNLALLI